MCMALLDLEISDTIELFIWEFVAGASHQQPVLVSNSKPSKTSLTTTGTISPTTTGTKVFKSKRSKSLKVPKSLWRNSTASK